MEVMQEYYENTTYLSNRVDYISSKFGSYKVTEIQDRYFSVLEKNDDVRNSILEVNN